MSDQEKCDTLEGCIEVDQESLKNELRALTEEERMLILKEYEEKAQEYGVGMQEFKEFMKWFDELED